MVQPASTLSGKLIVSSGRSMCFINIKSIRYVEACNYYALIHTEEKTHVVRMSLDEIEQCLRDHRFLRIHRSFILNVNIFQCIERKNSAMMVRTTIGRDFKVSRYRQKDVRSQLLLSLRSGNAC